MGEIKSTLDLVMERTRHMSLSAEEKAGQQLQEFEKRLSGLLQQYADQALSLNELESRIKSLQQETGVADVQVVVKSVLARLEPDQENGHWLTFLDRLNATVRDPLENILSAYTEKKVALLQATARQLLDNLSRKHGINGSAVVPNPFKDALCRKHLNDLRQDAQTRIAVISERI